MRALVIWGRLGRMLAALDPVEFEILVARLQARAEQCRDRAPMISAGYKRPS